MNHINKKIKKAINQFNRYRNENVPKLTFKSKRFRSMRKKLYKIFSDFPDCHVHLSSSEQDNIYNIDCEVIPWHYDVDAPIRFWFDNGMMGKGNFGLLACMFDNKKIIEKFNKVFITLKYVDVVREARSFKEEVEKYKLEKNVQ